VNGAGKGQPQRCELPTRKACSNIVPKVCANPAEAAKALLVGLAVGAPGVSRGSNLRLKVKPAAHRHAS
jgi:hypothetical protein